MAGIHTSTHSMPAFGASFGMFSAAARGSLSSRALSSAPFRVASFCMGVQKNAKSVDSNRRSSMSAAASRVPAAGILYVVATPIGNLEDISIRAAKTLLAADVIVAEDTRHSGKLLEYLRQSRLYEGLVAHGDSTAHALVEPGMTDEDIPRKQCSFVSLFEHNSNIDRVELILRNCKAKQQRVALVSDAGTPLISDPGALLIEQAHVQGVPVVPLPGPCALISALSVAGQPCTSFTFAGFLPKKNMQRIAALEKLLDHRQDEHSVVLYESPFRIRSTLAAIQSVVEMYGKPRGITVARELTKIHEQVMRFESVAACVQYMNDMDGEPRGEFVLVIGAVARKERRVDAASVQLTSEDAVTLNATADELLKELLSQGISVKQAVSVVNTLAQRQGRVSKLKSLLYGRAQLLKEEMESTSTSS